MEKAALGSVLALLAADALQLPAVAIAALAGLAAAAHLVRWLLWQPWKTLRMPLVWVLHVAYAWIPVHLLLRALAGIGWVGPSARDPCADGGRDRRDDHRDDDPHRARPHRPAAQGGSLGRGLLRAGAGLRAGARAWFRWRFAMTIEAIVVSAALWSSGFALYAACYWKVLTRPRLDGKPG